jgi:hypothetical protein
MQSVSFCLRMLAAEHAGDEFGGAGLAIGEGAAELARHDEALGEVAECAVGEFVLDFVTHECAVNGDAGLVGAGLEGEAMTVAPVGEGAADLHVAEVIVPDELGDLCLPWDADGGVGEWTEAEGHAGACAGGDAVEAESGIGGDRFGRRWGEGGLFDAGLLPGRHEAREILRIAEEGEDQLDGVREPLLGAESVAHV